MTPAYKYQVSSLPLLQPNHHQSTLEDLRTYFQHIRPMPTTSHSSSLIFAHPRLKDCSQVFIQNDTVRKPLQAPYDGPLKVSHHHTNTFEVEIKK